MTAPGSLSPRDYARWRARQIAYGRWRPWADAAPVREHVALLRQAGASYETIARAAGVSPMTVHRIEHGEPSKGRGVPNRLHAEVAERILAITQDGVRFASTRWDATGTRRRLQALTALGHPAAGLARSLGVSPETLWGIGRGTSSTVAPDLHVAVRDLYDQMWDLRPPERTGAERRAATAARARAARSGWPTPMGLDDEQIDNPGYRPRTRWRPATGAGIAESPLPDAPAARACREPEPTQEMEAAS